MAINSPQNNTGRYRGRQLYRPMAEINVTPFVDVMLVLLVVFMITAPLLNVGVPLDLPETQAKALSGNEEPLTISVNKDGAVYLMDRPVDLEELAPRLTAIAGNRGTEMRLYVRGDQAVNYGQVMKVMGILNSAGFRRVALVTASQDSTKK